MGILGRLSFVGLGLGAKGISLQGVEEIRSADAAYLEYYTNPHEPSLLRELQAATGKTLTIVDRAFVEDGNAILLEAKQKRVVLAVIGDPMVATTHAELRTRAIRLGIETFVVHAATIGSAAASASGLHFYKFSRTVTITREAIGQLSQAYGILHENLLEGAHTLLLLEYDLESGEGVSPSSALAGLLAAEENFKRGMLGGDSFALVLSRVGRPDQALRAGTFDDLKEGDFGSPPHCMVIPGMLHFTEAEAVSALFSIDGKRVHGNSDSVKRTAQVLVPKYVDRTQRALESVRGELGPAYAAVVENVELYMDDAETFLAKGEDELAMLSVGYAEGLLDSLNFAGVVKIDW
jgi:diphthine synthase